MASGKCAICKVRDPESGANCSVCKPIAEKGFDIRWGIVQGSDVKALQNASYEAMEADIKRLTQEAVKLNEAGKVDEAKKIAKEVSALKKKVKSGLDDATAAKVDALTKKALALQKEGKIDEAKKVAKEVTTMKKKAKGTALICVAKLDGKEVHKSKKEAGRLFVWNSMFDVAMKVESSLVLTVVDTSGKEYGTVTLDHPQVRAIVKKKTQMLDAGGCKITVTAESPVLAETIMTGPIEALAPHFKKTKAALVAVLRADPKADAAAFKSSAGATALADKHLREATEATAKSLGGDQGAELTARAAAVKKASVQFAKAAGALIKDAGASVNLKATALEFAKQVGALEELAAHLSGQDAEGLTAFGEADLGKGQDHTREAKKAALAAEMKAEAGDDAIIEDAETEEERAARKARREAEAKAKGEAAKAAEAAKPDEEYKGGSVKDRRKNMAKMNIPMGGPGKFGLPGMGPPRSLSKTIFDKYDVDKTGSLDQDQLQRLCFDYGYYLADDEVSEAVDALDKHSVGEVIYEDFKAWWGAGGSQTGDHDLRFELLHFDPDRLAMRRRAAETFKTFDKNGDGEIDANEFTAFHKFLIDQGLINPGVSAEDCMAVLDTNDDHAIQLHEYIAFILAVGEPKMKTAIAQGLGIEIDGAAKRPTLKNPVPPKACREPGCVCKDFDGIPGKGQTCVDCEHDYERHEDVACKARNCACPDFKGAVGSPCETCKHSYLRHRGLACRQPGCDCPCYGGTPGAGNSCDVCKHEYDRHEDLECRTRNCTCECFEGAIGKECTKCSHPYRAHKDLACNAPGCECNCYGGKQGRGQECDTCKHAYDLHKDLQCKEDDCVCGCFKGDIGGVCEDCSHDYRRHKDLECKMEGCGCERHLGRIGKDCTQCGHTYEYHKDLDCRVRGCDCPCYSGVVGGECESCKHDYYRHKEVDCKEDGCDCPDFVGDLDAAGPDTLCETCLHPYMRHKNVVCHHDNCVCTRYKGTNKNAKDDVPCEDCKHPFTEHESTREDERAKQAALLKSLGATAKEGGLLTITPNFDELSFSYQCKANLGDSEVTLSPVPKNPKAHVTVNGQETCQALLQDGDNKFEILVVSPDKSAQNTYTLEIFKPIPEPTGPPPDTRPMCEICMDRDTVCDKISEEFMHRTTKPHLDYIKHKFKGLDVNCDCMLDCDEVATMMRQMGKKKSKKQCQKMIEEVDSEGLGAISFRDFVRMNLEDFPSILRKIMMFEALSRGEKFKW